MPSEQSYHERLQGVFLQAVDLKLPEERSAFLSSACGGDHELRQAAEALLREHDEGVGLSPGIGAFPAENSGGMGPLEGPGTTIDRYKLTKEIGQGGFGSVYQAEQIEPVKRLVALKLIKPGMNTKEVIARFEAERQALAMMDHPGIARVLDAGTTESGLPYFVMELIDGRPITQFCNERQLDTHQRLNIYMDVCSAVQHAHQNGIIHRDLKPSNILVAPRADGAVPKVLDFGLAKAIEQPLTDKTLYTRMGQFIGTPAYMSPEQAGLTGEGIDTRSDVYALGVLLYELLTGKLPFDPHSLIQSGYDEMRRIIREDEPPKPSDRLGSLVAKERTSVARDQQTQSDKLERLLRGDLDWIVMKSIEKDRSRRYETVNAIADDIRRHLKDEPIAATAPSNAYKAQKFVKRNRSAVTIGAAMVLLMVLGTALSTWQAIVATKAKNQEAAARAELSVQLGETERAQHAEKDQRIRAEETLQHSLIRQAEHHIETGHAELGVAYLARVARDYPNNQIAAERLVNVLSQANIPLLRLHQEASSVLSADFSPDGTRFALSRNEQEIQVFDATSGMPIGVPIPQEGVMWATFSPDGGRIAATSLGEARIWDAFTGQPVSPIMPVPGWGKAYFSSDGSRVLTIGNDRSTTRVGVAQIWDAQTGKKLGEPMRHDKHVNTAVFSPDGEFVLTASNDRTARLWATGSGRQVGVSMLHDGPVRSAMFSPDGERVVTASEKIKLWDPSSCQLISEAVHEHMTKTEAATHFVRWATFSQDGQRLVTVSGFYPLDKEATARLWDVSSNEIRPLGVPMEHEGAIETVEFSPNGLHVITGSMDHTARVWSAHTGRPIGTAMRHTHTVSIAKFSPDGQRILTVAYGDMRVWDVRTSDVVAQPPSYRYTPPSIAESDNEELWIVRDFGDDNAVLIWNRRAQRRVATLKPETGIIGSAEFSRNSKWVVTREGSRLPPSGPPVLRVWNAGNGLPVGKPIVLPDIGSLVNDLTISNDRMRVLTVGMGGAQMWNVETGEKAGQLMAHDERVYEARFSPDGTRVATASEDDSARLWDVHTSLPIGQPMRHSADVLFLRFNPGGTLLATGSLDRTVRVWDAQTSAPVSGPLQDERPVRVLFSADGTRVATTRWWDARTGHPLSGQIPESHRNFGVTKLPRLQWDKPRASLPVPPWFPSWAEAVVGWRISGNGIPSMVSPGEMIETRESVFASDRNDSYTRIAKWYYAEPKMRTILPDSKLSVEAYTRQLETIPKGDFFLYSFDTRRRDAITGLRKALFYDPSNGLIFAKIVLLSHASDLSDQPNALGELAFFAEQAVKWAPDEAQAWRALAESRHANGLLDEALEASQTAVTLKPQSAAAWMTRAAILETIGQDEDVVRAYLSAFENLSKSDDFSLERYLLHRRLRDRMLKLGERAKAQRLHVLLESFQYVQANQFGDEPKMKVLLSPNSEWRWFHPSDGRDPSDAVQGFHERFYQMDFDDSEWAIARDASGSGGGFSYGLDPLLGTDIGEPDKPSHRHTAYFRCKFTSDQDASDLILRCQRSGGIIVYLDGREIIRDNISDDPDSYRLPGVNEFTDEVRRFISRHRTPNMHYFVHSYPIAVPLSAGEHVLAISLHYTPKEEKLRIAGITLGEIMHGEN